MLWINKISEIMEEVDKHKKQKSGELKREADEKRCGKGDSVQRTGENENV